MKYLAFEKSVGGVIFREEGGKRLFLLLQYRSGQWDFLKGHTEGGEGELETLRREIKEESGIGDVHVLTGPRICVRYFYRAWGNEKKERMREGRGIYIFKKVVYYPVKTGQKDIILDHENKDFGWFSLGGCLRRLGNKDSKKVLIKITSFIKRNSA